MSSEVPSPISPPINEYITELCYQQAEDGILYHNYEPALTPLEEITWEGLLSFLKGAANPRWCPNLKAAIDSLSNGVFGDVLAAYESFAHLVYVLRRDDVITIPDHFEKLSPQLEIHSHTWLILQKHAESLDNTNARAAAWEKVEAFFTNPGNGFNENVREAILKAFYGSMMQFLSFGCGGYTAEPALVLVRIQGQNFHRKPDENHGYLGKFGQRFIPASSFLRQIFVNDGILPSKENEVNQKKKRAFAALLHMSRNSPYA